MPILTSTYEAPVWLRSGHLQTVLRALIPPRAVPKSRRERLELDDGDFLDLDWWQTGDGSRLAVICHGLEGSSEALYVRECAASLLAEGWSVLAWNCRGCSGEPNRLVRSYHSGGTDDLDAVIRHALSGSRVKRLALVGFSLGGNLVLKYAGERGEACHVDSVVAVSAPVDLASSAEVLDRAIGNRYYLFRFLKTLAGKVRAKSERFPGQVDSRAWKGVRTIREIDEFYTGPVHGFADAEDYWANCSARGFLASVCVPSLLVSAVDDPLLAGPSFPREIAEQSPHFFLEAPATGGHVAFLGRKAWLGRRIVSFVDSGERM